MFSGHDEREAMLEIIENNHRKVNKVEIEPSPEALPEIRRFNWAAFWTMLFSIILVVALVLFIPGPFDEIAATVILSAINAFIVANNRK